MTILISVDPGIRATGVGVFRDQLLINSQYVKNPLTSGLGPLASATMALVLVEWLDATVGVKPDYLVLEWPQVYKVSKGDPNDLLPLAGVDAALTTLLRTQTIHYLPEQWKGQLPKEVMCDRIVGRLSAEEKENIHNVGALTHNVIDSIGLGLHYLGRLQPKKVFAR